LIEGAIFVEEEGLGSRRFLLPGSIVGRVLGMDVTEGFGGLDFIGWRLLRIG